MTGCETPEWLGVVRVLIIFLCGIGVGIGSATLYNRRGRS